MYSIVNMMKFIHIVIIVVLGDHDTASTTETTLRLSVFMARSHCFALFSTDFLKNVVYSHITDLLGSRSDGHKY